MSRKKDQAVMELLVDEADFMVFVDKAGLAVIDVYQRWCGQCKPVQVLFKRLKVQLGAGFVRFGAVDCLSVPELEKFNGNCEPIFLLYANGQHLGRINGCDAPVIEKTILQAAKIEQQIISGDLTENDRIQIDANEATSIAQENTKDIKDEVEKVASLTTHEINQIVTCLIIKPDIINQENTVKEILEMIELNGISILLDEKRQLSTGEADLIFHSSSQEYKDFITSDTVHIMGLTKGETGINIVNLVKEMCGPSEPHTAKIECPRSIRARYGTDLIENAVHCSESVKEAAEEISCIFPKFSSPIVSMSGQLRDEMIVESVKSKLILEDTLTVVRPSSCAQYKDDIINEALEAGYKIIEKAELTMNDEQFQKIYSRHVEEEYYENLKEEMMSGPCLILHLRKEDALLDWRSLIGPMLDAKENAPNSLRAKYAVGEVNPIHAASNRTQAKLEIEMFFAEVNPVGDPEGGVEMISDKTDEIQQ